ncbi:hypothetical protein EsDP_00005387 [Epichloe bromicola]|uniref:V-snare n=1 Tax=Epichloe bromicola TaxID=79588 RepID=A0ABQ0CUH8_9HYPO
MPSKRELQDLDEGEISEPGSKRAKRQTGATPRHQHQNSSIDPTWGQKYVFSSLGDATTIPYGDESDFEDDADAMAYLHSVRKEAYNIPHLLVAPKVQIGPQLPPDLQNNDRDNDDDEIDDGLEAAAPIAYTKEVMQGYYDDGAYIAMPDEDWKIHGEDGELDSDVEGDARVQLLHESYFASLMKKYARLRKLLHSKPPTDAAKRLSSTQVTHAAPFGRNSNTNKVWANLIRNTDPHPLQLALMSKETVILVLRVLIGGNFLQRGHTLSERTTQWIWGLLARLPDRGELNHTEIGWIRDLGRRAVLLGISLEEMATMRDALSDGELGVNEDADASSRDEDALYMNGEDVEEETVAHGDAPEDGQYTAGDDENPHVDATNNANGDENGEEGGVQEQSVNGDDAAMEIDSGSEDGEARDEHGDLEAAKRGLLARLNDESDTEEQWEENEAQEEAKTRLRMNLRATLSMILTVAGDFYGQRDLLEFRNPFLGL